MILPQCVIQVTYVSTYLVVNFQYQLSYDMFQMIFIDKIKGNDPTSKLDRIANYLFTKYRTRTHQEHETLTALSYGVIDKVMHWGCCSGNNSALSGVSTPVESIFTQLSTLCYGSFNEF